ATPDSCAGVWVVVDATAAGGSVTTACATSYATGTDALQSAGVTVTHSSDGMICQLNALPSKCAVSANAYWGYYQATPTATGWSTWAYATTGADASQPKAGNAEGWVFGDSSTTPSVYPPAPGDGTSVAPAPEATPAPEASGPASTAAPEPSASASVSPVPISLEPSPAATPAVSPGGSRGISGPLATLLALVVIVGAGVAVTLVRRRRA
ncbi:MAG: hypothetical protein FWF28_11235, partial [Micrococcales bacterium]|nr:hypothetical protein [Micrococcales bacterium]